MDKFFRETMYSAMTRKALETFPSSVAAGTGVVVPGYSGVGKARFLDLDHLGHAVAKCSESSQCGTAQWIDHWVVLLESTRTIPRFEWLNVMSRSDRSIIEAVIGEAVPEWQVVDTLVQLAKRRGNPSSILIDRAKCCQDLTGWAKRNNIELVIRNSVCPLIGDGVDGA